LARQGGEFDFIGPVREVKTPTLPHRTRGGWGTRVCWWRGRAAIYGRALHQKRFVLQGWKGYPNAQI